MSGGRADLSFAARANRYARDVADGKINVCKWVKLACQRHLDDLTRWPNKRSDFYFDEDAANHVCAVISNLRHVKGEWANRRETIRLEDWQCFVLGSIFGWKRNNGKRRFRTAYEEVPRKNAKSTKAAGIGIYGLAFDGEAGAEIYAAAPTRDQTRPIFSDTAQQMVRMDPELQAARGIAVGAHNIHQLSTASKFETLAGDASTNDGWNIHIALIDELHAHKSSRLFDVLITGHGSRSQPLDYLPTTAGFDQSGVCFAQRNYVTKILERRVEDESYFGIIYTIDDDDDWTDPAIWAKANPNFGISVDPDDIAAHCRRAQQLASEQGNFLTKRLNVWVGADVGLFDMLAWARCADESLSIDDFAREPVWTGVDLASTTDIASVCHWFTRRDQHYVFCRHYAPEAAIWRPENTNYQGWEAEGRLISSPGNQTNFELIYDDLCRDYQKFRNSGCGFDPWQGKWMMEKLGARGAKVVEVPMRTNQLSPPTKDIIGLHLDGKIHHDGDPVLSWMCSNVVGHYDANDNVFPKKLKPENKIDGAVAMIVARNLSMRHQANAKPTIRTL